MKKPQNESEEQCKQSFFDSLQSIVDKTKTCKEIKIGEIFAILSGKGYAALLILFSLPFCLPFQIPGFSTPFGIILGFLGFRLAFAKRLWWPEWILEKKLNSQHVEKTTQRSMKIVKALQKVLHPRLCFLTKNSIPHRIHGLLIVSLSILLSLPLPIPMTNLLAATPILLIGLGLLEDDGVAIIIGYILALICFSVFIFLFFWGKAQISHWAF